MAAAARVGEVRRRLPDRGRQLGRRAVSSASFEFATAGRIVFGAGRAAELAVADGRRRFAGTGMHRIPARAASGA